MRDTNGRRGQLEARPCRFEDFLALFWNMHICPAAVGKPSGTSLATSLQIPLLAFTSIRTPPFPAMSEKARHLCTSASRVLTLGLGVQRFPNFFDFCESLDPIDVIRRLCCRVGTNLRLTDLGEDVRSTDPVLEAPKSQPKVPREF